tara:strand:+ start:152 stop:382 length:231 start_codon:yes stop_codon:yes gene_type:complete
MEDAEWSFFEQFIIAIRGRGGRPARNHRLVLDGVFWIARTGAQWRDLPEDSANGIVSTGSFGVGHWRVCGTWSLRR